MAADLVERIKKSFGGDSRPEIPLACPLPRTASVSCPLDIIRSQPRVHVRGGTAASPSRIDVRDAACSPPSVLSQYLGPPVVEHKYPQDSKWRRHSISAQEQYFTR